jgi:hypothetical protein
MIMMNFFSPLRAVPVDVKETCDKKKSLNEPATTLVSRRN